LKILLSATNFRSKQSLPFESAQFFRQVGRIGAQPLS
jgi:hypothetical protein